MKCPKCGTSNLDGAIECRCGVILDKAVSDRFNPRHNTYSRLKRVPESRYDWDMAKQMRLALPICLLLLAALWWIRLDNRESVQELRQSDPQLQRQLEHEADARRHLQRQLARERRARTPVTERPQPYQPSAPAPDAEELEERARRDASQRQVERELDRNRKAE